MNNYHTALYYRKRDKVFLKRLTVPSNKILNKFYWEKLKQEHLTKLLRLKDLEPYDVIINEFIDKEEDNLADSRKLA